jgi:hypothetical protein
MDKLVFVFINLSTEGLIAVFLMIIIGLWVLRERSLSSNDLVSERLLLEKLRTSIATLNDDEQLDEYAVDKLLETLKSGNPSSLVRRVTLAIINTRVVNNADIEAIMGLLFSRESMRLSSVRAAPNLLMLAGLLGTVFGLATAVGGLSSQITQSIKQGNINDLSSALIETLGSMKGAFGATLWGVLLSGISTLVLGGMSASRAKFATELQDFVLIHLVPAVFPRSSGEQLEEQRKIAKRSQQSIQQLKDVLELAVKSFDTILGNTGDRVQKSLELLGDATQTAQKAFGEVMGGVDQLKTALKDGADNLAIAQHNSAKIFENASEDLKQQLSGQARQIDAFQQSFVTSGSKILEGIFDIGGRLDNTVKAFRDEGSNQLNQSNKVLDRFESRFENLEKVLAPKIDNSVEILKGISIVIERLDNTLEVFQNEGINQINQSNNVLDRLEDRFENLEKVLVPKIDTTDAYLEILKGIAIVTERLDNTLEVFQNEGTNQLNQSNKILDRFEGLFENLEKTLVSKIETHHEILKDISEVTERLDNTVNVFQNEGTNHLSNSNKILQDFEITFAPKLED